MSLVFLFPHESVVCIKLGSECWLKVCWIFILFDLLWNRYYRISFSSVDFSINVHEKKNVFSNAMLLSIKRLQYFVLSLSCHGCLLKNKFLCLFLGRPAFMYPPFFSVTIQDIFLTVFSFNSYSVYVFRKEAFKLFKYIQSNQINTWLLVHACEILDLGKKNWFICFTDTVDY